MWILTGTPGAEGSTARCFRALCRSTRVRSHHSYVRVSGGAYEGGEDDSGQWAVGSGVWDAPTLEQRQFERAGGRTAGQLALSSSE